MYLSAAESSRSNFSYKITSPKDGLADSLVEYLVNIVLEEELVHDRQLLLDKKDGRFNSFIDKILCLGELDCCLLSVLLYDFKFTIRIKRRILTGIIKSRAREFF